MDKKDAIKCLKSIQKWVPDWDDREDRLSYLDAIDMAIAALDTPNAEKPPCYLPEKDNPYPLCEGRGMKACAHCCLWEDYAPGEDESRVNQPLTMWRLREMDGPVWVACKPIEGGDGYWCLCRYGHITTPGGKFFEVGEIPHWVFYRRPPEGEEDT